MIILVSWSFGAIASTAEGHHHLLAADHKIFSWFQEHSTRPLIDFAARVSHFGSAIVLAALQSQPLSFCFCGERGIVCFCSFSPWAAAECFAFFCGFSIGRCQFRKMVFAALPSETFPSWHAMGSILFYGTLAAFIGTSLTALRWRALTLLIACVIVLLIAMTRIYLGAHYVTDVIGAISAGLVWLVWCQIGIALMREPQDHLPLTRPSSSPLPLPLSLALALVFRADICRARAKKRGRGRGKLLHSALSGSPDEFVHLQLKTNAQIIRQNPFHNFARIDSAEDRRK